jgi:hypothetical protein
VTFGDSPGPKGAALKKSLERETAKNGIIEEFKEDLATLPIHRLHEGTNNNT